MKSHKRNWKRPVHETRNIKIFERFILLNFEWVPAKFNDNIMYQLNVYVMNPLVPSKNNRLDLIKVETENEDDADFARREAWQLFKNIE